MSPATAEKPRTKDEKQRKVRFFADGRGAAITMKNQDEVINQRGVKVPIGGTGHRIEFQEDGYGGQFYETTDPEEIQFLRERANMFGVIKEIPVPVPPSAPVLAQIIKLVRKGDADALVALAAQEEESHGREDVIEAIADALESLKPE